MLNFDELFDKAKVARELSYSPYSNFKVGAVIECKDGTVIYGANIENASYGLSMCAERNALYSAYLRGYKKNDFLQMFLVSNSQIITTPCGACRQVICELFPENAPIYCANLEKKYIKTSIAELLPYSFGEGNLKK